MRSIEKVQKLQICAFQCNHYHPLYSSQFKDHIIYCIHCAAVILDPVVQNRSNHGRRMAFEILEILLVTLLNSLVPALNTGVFSACRHQCFNNVSLQNLQNCVCCKMHKLLGKG